MPQYLNARKHTAKFLQSQWNSYNGSDAQGFLKSSIFGTYCISDPNTTELEIATAQKNKTSFRFNVFLDNAFPSHVLIKWLTLGHTGVDVNWLGFGPTHERMAGNHDNTEIVRFIQQSLHPNLSNVTEILNGSAAFLENYVGTTVVRDGIVQKKSLPRRAHSDHHVRTEFDLYGS
jgi:alkaline phosphatase